jgi:RNA recognition motif-containing protein
MSTKTKLFVHGLRTDMGENQRYSFILELFGKYGEVSKEDITLIKDHERGGFKNFCFVEMDAEAAEKVMADLNDATTEDGVTLSISVARPRESNGGGSGGYRQNNGGGGGYRRDY